MSSNSTYDLMTIREQLEFQLSLRRTQEKEFLKILYGALDAFRALEGHEHERGVSVYIGLTALNTKIEHLIMILRAQTDIRAALELLAPFEEAVAKLEITNYAIKQ